MQVRRINDRWLFVGADDKITCKWSAKIKIFALVVDAISLLATLIQNQFLCMHCPVIIVLFVEPSRSASTVRWIILSGAEAAEILQELSYDDYRSNLHW